jgi:hypothetical protein
MAQQIIKENYGKYNIGYGEILAKKLSFFK